MDPLPTKEEKLAKYKDDLQKAEMALAALRHEGYKVEVIIRNIEAAPEKLSVEYVIWRKA